MLKQMPIKDGIEFQQKALQRRLKQEFAQLGLPMQYLQLSSDELTQSAKSQSEVNENDEAIESALLGLVYDLKLFSIVAHFQAMAGSDLSTFPTKLAPDEHDGTDDTKSELVSNTGKQFSSVPSWASVNSRIQRLNLFSSMRRHQALLSIFDSLEILWGHVSAEYVAQRSQQERDVQFNTTSNAFRLASTALSPTSPREPRPPNLGIGQEAQQNQNQPALQRANAFAIVVNLDELRRTIIPLFWLSFKLSFLLYIFGRHASYRKRILLCSMALAWIAWEGWSMRSRRAAQGRRLQAMMQEQQQQAQRQPGVRGQPWNGLRPGVIIQRAGRQNGVTVGIPQPINDRAHPQIAAARPRPANTENERPNVPRVAARQEVAAPRNRHHAHTSRSVFSFAYWVNRVAAVGMARESRELGLARMMREARGRPLAPLVDPEDEDNNLLYRWMYTFYVLVVLFLGTLVPDVERKRKKALEKRDKLYREAVTKLQARSAGFEDRNGQLRDATAALNAANERTKVETQTMREEMRQAIQNGRPIGDILGRLRILQHQITGQSA